MKKLVLALALVSFIAPAALAVVPADTTDSADITFKCTVEPYVTIDTVVTSGQDNPDTTSTTVNGLLVHNDLTQLTGLGTLTAGVTVSANVPFLFSFLPKSTLVAPFTGYAGGLTSSQAAAQDRTITVSVDYDVNADTPAGDYVAVMEATITADLP